MDGSDLVSTRCMSDSSARRRLGTDTSSETVSSLRPCPRFGEATNSISICFRISNIPPDWDKEQVLEFLRQLEQSLGDLQPQLSLNPPLSGIGGTKTALLKLYMDSSTYFLRLDPNTTCYEKLSSGGNAESVAIDRHFYGLTPLYTPTKIVAE
jgi:hypothetical protein